MRHFKFTTKVVLQLILAVLTVASLSVTTFAWFSMQGSVTVSFWEMVVPDDIHVQLKYCIHNQSSKIDASGASSIYYPGYNDPKPPTTTDAGRRKTITDYAAQFISIPDNKYVVDGPLDIKGLEPGTCHTFAFEIEIPAGSARNIELRLEGFSAPESETKRITTSDHGISLSSAMDIYAYGWEKGDNATNTTHASTMINEYATTLTTPDKFVYYDASETKRADGYQLWTGTVNGGVTEIVFCTLDFTDMSSTYYKYSYTDGTKDYYVRDAAGDSNCYRGLDFNITNLYVGDVAS